MRALSSSNGQVSGHGDGHIRGQVGQVGQVAMSARRASDIKPELKEWLWPGFVPIGTTTILESDPECGKSTITYDLAACVSSGHSIPFRSEQRKPAGVVMLLGEVSVATTTIPALLAAGADDKRIWIQDTHLDLLAWLEDLEHLVVGADARLVVIDPISEFVQNLSKEPVARYTFRALNGLARRHQLAVVVIRHLSKSRHVNAQYDGLGSIGMRAAARSTLRISSDETRPRTHILRHEGNEDESGRIGFRLTQKDGVVCVKWHALSPVVRRTQSQLKEAKDFLVHTLARSAVPSTDVFAAAKAQGISPRTLVRAKQDLQVAHKRVSRGKTIEYMWHFNRNAIRSVIEHLLRSCWIGASSDAPSITVSGKSIWAHQYHVNDGPSVRFRVDGDIVEMTVGNTNRNFDLRDPQSLPNIREALASQGLIVDLDDAE